MPDSGSEWRRFSDDRATGAVSELRTCCQCQNGISGSDRPLPLQDRKSEQSSERQTEISRCLDSI